LSGKFKVAGEAVLVANACCSRKFTEMHMLSTKGDDAGVRRLLLAHPGMAKIKDGTGQFPLHLAAAAGSLPCVKLLMIAYPDALQIKSDTGWKPDDNAKKYKQADWQAVVATMDPTVRLALEVVPGAGNVWTDVCTPGSTGVGAAAKVAALESEVAGLKTANHELEEKLEAALARAAAAEAAARQ
jgi:hypothetical protein